MSKMNTNKSNIHQGMGKAYGNFLCGNQMVMTEKSMFNQVCIIILNRGVFLFIKSYLNYVKLHCLY